MKYHAFLSYSHRDSHVAAWLHKALEGFAVPPALVGQPTPAGVAPAHFKPIFRDRDELPSSDSLGAEIEKALNESAWLIVLCSPASAASPWVNAEITQFQNQHSAKRVLCLIIEGDADDKPVFPSAIGGEPLAADIRTDGKQRALLRLLAGMLGVGFDQLFLRAQKQSRRRYAAWGGFLGAITLGFLALGAYLGWEKRQALQAQAHQQRLERLSEQGRQELLAGNSARAAVLLHAAYAGGHDDPNLRFMLGQALRPLEAVEKSVQAHPVGDTQAAFRPQGDELVSVGSDNVVRFWNPDLSPKPHHLKLPTAVRGLDLGTRSDRLLTVHLLAGSSWTPTLTLWDTHQNQALATVNTTLETWPRLQTRPMSVSNYLVMESRFLFSEDGKWVSYVSPEQQWRRIDTETGQIHQPPAPCPKVRLVREWHANQQLLACEDGRVLVLQQGRIRYQWRGDSPLYDAAVGKAGNQGWLAFQQESGLLHLWKPPAPPVALFSNPNGSHHLMRGLGAWLLLTGSDKFWLIDTQHQEPVFSADVSLALQGRVVIEPPYGQALNSGGSNDTFRLLVPQGNQIKGYKLLNGQADSVWDNLGISLSSLGFHPQNTTEYLLADSAGTLRRVRRNPQTTGFFAHSHNTTTNQVQGNLAASLVLRGEQLISLSADNQAHVWQGLDRQQTTHHSLPFAASPWPVARLNRRGDRLLLSGWASKVLEVWPVPPAAPPAVLPQPLHRFEVNLQDNLTWMDFSDDDASFMLASFRAPGLLRWRSEDGAPLPSEFGQHGVLKAVQHPTDPAVILAVDLQGWFVWLRDGKVAKTLWKLGLKSDSDTGFSRDGRYVFVVNDRLASAYVWDTQQEKWLAALPLQGYQRRLLGYQRGSFSPDGKHLALLLGERLLIWSWQSGESHAATIEGDFPNGVDFSQDSQRVFVSTISSTGIGVYSLAGKKLYQFLAGNLPSGSQDQHRHGDTLAVALSSDNAAALWDTAPESRSPTQVQGLLEAVGWRLAGERLLPKNVGQ
jgi:WD40 repeat protein